MTRTLSRNHGTRLVALLLLIAPEPIAWAAEGTVKIRESALNEFYDAVKPLRFAQRAAPVDLPWCDEIASFELDRLAFRIRSGNAVEVTGGGDGKWCNVDFDVDFSTNAIFRYVNDTRTARVSFIPAPVSVSVRVPEWLLFLAWIHFIPIPPTIGFSLIIDFNSSLGGIPPIPVDATVLTVETLRGPRRLELVGRDIQIRSQDAARSEDRYLLVRGDVVLR